MVSGVRTRGKRKCRTVDSLKLEKDIGGIASGVKTRRKRKCRMVDSLRLEKDSARTTRKEEVQDGGLVKFNNKLVKFREEYEVSKRFAQTGATWRTVM